MIGKLEVRRSLKTSDIAEAKRRVRIERVKVEAEFDRARRSRRLVAELASPPELTLSDEEVWALATQWFVDAERLNLERNREPVDAELLEARLDDLDHIERWEEVSTSVHAEIDRLLRQNGLSDVAVGTPQPWRARLSQAIHAAMIESARRQVSRAGGPGFAREPAFGNLSAATASQPVAKTAVTVARLIARFQADPTRDRPATKSKLKHDAQYRFIKEVIGAKTLVRSIDREAARKVVAVVQRLPANVTKRFGGKSIEEALRIAEERKLKPMSITTANDYLGTFSALMEFAVREEIIDRNPAKGLRLAGDGVKRKDKRLPFSVADLASIFAAPLYSGCRDDMAGFARPGPNRPRRGRFWVPLVSLFSGMRLNEVCQLTEDDVTVMDGVHVIVVRLDEDGTKRVKTEAGARFVPVHPELAQLGFVEHVTRVRALRGPGARLFPELNVASTGYFSDNFSKWYARFLDKVGIKDPRKNFHSFRHTFRDALREAEIPQDRVRELGGWSSGNTEDDYGSGTRPSTLAREIAKVRYDGLDLSHLYLPGAGRPGLLASSA